MNYDIGGSSAAVPTSGAVAAPTTPQRPRFTSTAAVAAATVMVLLGLSLTAHAGSAAAQTGSPSQLAFTTEPNSSPVGGPCRAASGSCPCS